MRNEPRPVERTPELKIIDEYRGYRLRYLELVQAMIASDEANPESPKGSQRIAQLNTLLAQTLDIPEEEHTNPYENLAEVTRRLELSMVKTELESFKRYRSALTQASQLLFPNASYAFPEVYGAMRSCLWEWSRRVDPNVRD